MQVSWKGQRLGAGVSGLWSNPSSRAAVDCGEMDRGDVREEIVGEMPVEESQAATAARQQGDSAESRVGGGAITVASLSPQATIGS